MTEENSCLQVVPGAFGLFPSHDHETGFLAVAPELDSNLQGVSIEMEPGDALIFDQLTLHRALPNRSDRVRWSIDIRFERTEFATPRGAAQGAIARSVRDPQSVTSYETWERKKWDSIPEGAY